MLDKTNYVDGTAKSLWGKLLSRLVKATEMKAK